MDIDKSIKNIVGNGKYTTNNITRGQTPYSRNIGIQRVNYVDVDRRVKRIFDKFPEVSKATGTLLLTLKDGKTLKVNLNYQ